VRLPKYKAGMMSHGVAGFARKTWHRLPARSGLADLGTGGGDTGLRASRQPRRRTRNARELKKMSETAPNEQPGRRARSQSG